MNHTTATSTSTSISTPTSTKTHDLSTRLVAVVTTLVLGLGMLGGVGFVQGSGDFVHNAAHDTRHSISFPCH